jgi:hypothetical protein
MKSRISLPFLLLATSVAVALSVNPIAAQVQNGNLHGLVQSEDGDALPGVAVELSGLGATLLQTSDGQGQFRFLGLAPGSYQVAASLDGYSPVVHENVTVAVGRNTSIEITLMSAIEELITVTAESPVLDERKISAGGRSSP